ncbi:MAG TPA: hypothetical protein VJ969_04575 [Desulfopila sp.]|nr:hypothetical protein [Desulfopila sp.]
MLFGCNTAKDTSSKSISKAIAGEPSVYCTVVSPPDPDLFGHWIGQNSNVKGEVWFGERNGKYAFFYKWERLNSDKGNAKWRPNIVDGNTIRNPEGVMKFWVEDGVFYSQFKNEPVTTFKRVETDAAVFQKKQLTGVQLQGLLGEGKELQLGGPSQSYHGQLSLAKDGTGEGWAITDNGRRINIKGTWNIRDDEFCRTWQEVSSGITVCEKWIAISDNTVEVYANGKKVGVNSWQ